jgi:integrase
LKPGPARREVPDGKIPGLYLIVQPSGAKSWAFRYRYAGKSRKHTIGSYPAISVGRARELAQQAAGAVAEGRDPHSEKAEGRRAQAFAACADQDIVEKVVDTFIERYARVNLRESTFNECKRVLGKEVVKPWQGKRLSEIQRSDMHNLLDRIVDRGSPITANRTLAYFRRMCNWAVERGIIEASPCQGVNAPTVERSRDRVLDGDEIKGIWKVCDEIGWPFGPMVKMLILTGARRHEVAAMRWLEIDLAAKLWTLPRERAKNDRQHVIPLSDPAIGILEALPRIEGKLEYVFTSNGETAVSGFSRAKARIDRQMPHTPSWVLHDIRRSVASGMARIGVQLHVIERCLNHVSGSFAGIVGVYQRHSFKDEMTDAMTRWGAYVERLASDDPSNVVPLVVLV